MPPHPAPHPTGRGRISPLRCPLAWPVRQFCRPCRGRQDRRGGGRQPGRLGPNRALFAFVYGKHFSLARGGRVSVLRTASTVFAISGAGPARTRDMVQADADLILAAISGKKTKLATGKQAKGKPWPYYYGISPTGPYPDQPDIRGLYYDGAPSRFCSAAPGPCRCLILCVRRSLNCRRPGRAARLRTASGAANRPSARLSGAAARPLSDRGAQPIYALPSLPDCLASSFGT